MRRLGFTVLEVLTCISIVVVVAAFISPALRSARESAQREQSVSKLQQIYIAVSIYRSDWDGNGQYGEYTRMGLPLWVSDTKLPPSIFHSGCPSLFENPPGAILTQMWHPDPSPGQDWGAYALREKGNAALVGDENCDYSREDLHNPMVKHRGIAVYEAGYVRTVIGYGNTGDYDWWNPEVE